MLARKGAVRVSQLILSGLLTMARLAAHALTAADLVIRPVRSARVFKAVRAMDGSPFETLARIWFGRATREALRIALRIGLDAAVMSRVALTGNVSAATGPCVYAIYHTPWGRVMANWLKNRPRTALYATGRWESRARSAHVACNPAGLRQVISALKRGENAAVTIDHFTESGSSRAVSFLGRQVRASTGAARIARAAGVPVVPVTARFCNGRLELEIGERLGTGDKTPECVTAELFEAFDRETRRDPGGWEGSYGFLERAGAMICAPQKERSRAALRLERLPS